MIKLSQESTTRHEPIRALRQRRGGEHMSARACPSFLILPPSHRFMFSRDVVAAFPAAKPACRTTNHECSPAEDRIQYTHNTARSCCETEDSVERKAHHLQGELQDNNDPSLSIVSSLCVNLSLCEDPDLTKRENTIESRSIASGGAWPQNLQKWY